VLQEPLHPYTRLLLSAVPDPETGLAGKRLEARPRRGALDLLSGCRFVDRCPLAIDVCLSVPPTLVAARPHHIARCHVTAPATIDREEDRVEHLH
jgi:oligopeptide/dipeptide ABC transporter ATP-binding protein